MKLPMTIAFAVVLITGCVLPIPTPHGKILEGTEVTPATLAFLKPQQTTAAEVTDQLGPPAIFWRDENTFVYRWVQRKGIILWAVGAGYSGEIGATDVTAEYAFLIKFDPTDHYAASEILRKPASKKFGQFLLDWRDAQRAKKGGARETSP